MSLRRQRFPAQGSIEIHEDGEVRCILEASGQHCRRNPRRLDGLPNVYPVLCWVAPCCSLGFRLPLAQESLWIHLAVLSIEGLALLVAFWMHHSPTVVSHSPAPFCP